MAAIALSIILKLCGSLLPQRPTSNLHQQQVTLLPPVPTGIGICNLCPVLGEQDHLMLAQSLTSLRHYHTGPIL